MNKLLNDYQLLELENAELRNRIAELKATPTYPAAVFSLHSKAKDDVIKYIIFDHAGDQKAYFYADSEHIAVQIFNTFKKKWKPTKTEVITNDYDNNNFYALTRLSSILIQLNEVKEMIFYVISINGKGVKYIDNCPEEEAIEKYNDIIFEEMNKTSQSTIITRLI